MIVAAAVAAQPVATQMTYGWFDGFVIILLGFGLFRGRRNGMSKEFLPLLQWLVLVLLCGFLYPLAGQFFINTLHWGKLMGFVCGYLVLAFVVMIIFGILRKLFAERLVKSNAFKDGEYYLGMLAGLIRCACIIIVLLALLNAPVYTQAEIQAHAAYIQKTYGGGQQGFSGDYFPTLQQIQEQVFTKSFCGPIIKNNLGFLLIKDTAPPPLPPKPKPKPVIQFGNQSVNPPAPKPAPPAGNQPKK